MNQLNWRAKIALVLLAPFYVGIVLLVLAISFAWWIFAMILKVTGFLDAFIFLLKKTLQINTKANFNSTFGPVNPD